MNPRLNVYTIFSVFFLTFRTLLIHITSNTGTLIGETVDFSIISRFIEYDIVFLFLAMYFYNKQAIDHGITKIRVQGFLFYTALILPLTLIILWILMTFQDYVYGVTVDIQDIPSMFAVTMWVTIIVYSVSAPVILGIEFLESSPSKFRRRFVLLSIITFLSYFLSTTGIIQNQAFLPIIHYLPYGYTILAILVPRFF